MSHPIDLLIAAEDGTLDPAERAALDAHLQDCAKCQDEVRAASAAREALRSATPPVMPAGLLDDVRAQAEALAEDRGVRSIATARSARWQRVASAAGVAAAIVLVAAVALPRLGDQGPGLTDVRSEAAALDQTAATAVEVQDTDYELDSIEGLATAYRATTTDAAGVEGAPVTGAATDTGAPLAELPPGEATACLRRAFEGLPGEPVRLIKARYEGTPAYLGVFLVGPGAGEAPTTAHVLIAATADCSILATSQVSLAE
jgi:hypothetical protein